MRKTELKFVLQTITNNGLAHSDFKYNNTESVLSITFVRNERLAFHFKANPESFLEFTMSYFQPSLVAT
jgi:hypothetical protein